MGLGVVFYFPGLSPEILAKHSLSRLHTQASGAHTHMHFWSICMLCVFSICPTPCNPMDCNMPGSSVPGILQARILEWAVISSSRGSSRSRDQTCISCVSCIGRQILYRWASGEARSICTQTCYSLDFSILLGVLGLQGRMRCKEASQGVRIYESPWRHEQELLPWFWK